MMPDLYDPLTYENLMAGLASHFDSIEKSQLGELEVVNVEGPGIYALFYTGDLEIYQTIAENQPIYVGKAIPPGGRKGGKLDVTKPAIFGRLRNHTKSIEAAHNLDLAHFQYRSLAVVPVWITLAEHFLVENYMPVWNVCLEGFGKHDPGGARLRGKRSWWDTLHPGRAWAESEQAGAKTPEIAETMVREFLDSQTDP